MKKGRRKLRPFVIPQYAKDSEKEGGAYGVKGKMA